MDHIHGHLVGGFNHLEKYEFVKWDDDIPFPTVSGNHKKTMFQSPPTRHFSGY